MKKTGVILAMVVAFLTLIFSFEANYFQRLNDSDISYRFLNWAVEELRQKHGFSQAELDTIFSGKKLRVYPGIINRIGPVPRCPDYINNTKFALASDGAIKKGRRVLQERQSVLSKNEKVPGKIIVAIYRMETAFGAIRGNYKVINALYTLTVMENRRSQFYAKELVAWLVLCKKLNWEPFSFYGSWSGAIGPMQFIPSSILKYGIDGSGDDFLDPLNLEDGLASAANHLLLAGWQTGNKEKMIKALCEYNRCRSYAEAVLLFADKL